MDSKHSILIICVIAAVTFLTRSLPFLIFPGSRKTPKYVLYLGKVLPPAIIGMLIVYSLKDTEVLLSSHGIPELVCIAVIAVLHLWKKNVLVSIGAGTVLYMFLIQQVFY